MRTKEGKNRERRRSVGCWDRLSLHRRARYSRLFSQVRCYQTIWFIIYTSDQFTGGRKEKGFINLVLSSLLILMVKIHFMDWQLYCNLKSYCLAPLLTRQEVSFHLLYCFLWKTKTLGIGWSSGCTWEAGFSTSGQAESISCEITWGTVGSWGFTGGTSAIWRGW